MSELDLIIEYAEEKVEWVERNMGEMLSAPAYYNTCAAYRDIIRYSKKLKAEIEMNK